MKTSNNLKDQTSQEVANQPAGLFEGLTDTQALTILRDLLEPQPKPGMVEKKSYGQPVRLDDAKNCIDYYKTAIEDHGFKNDRDEELKLFIRSRKKTEYEEFEGNGLLKWMLTTADKLSKRGNVQVLGIQLHFGIYTKSFLETYLHGQPELQAQKSNRMTIFLIFKYSPTFTTDHIKIGDIDDEITAYELGGIEP